ncbi:hypothetical protein E2K99_02905 [Herbaspirillum huttiense]|uniref:hypothetical protein n=1 Tax=Herbaspirillum huttiense TaxID=863372 RepID=UPI0010657A2D|nr:hypothetical protein [Herbaspirillum huttiense]QBP74025.1 hypothetical protein E2K99_02905 [Herbaspirillum huttiense]
MEKLKSLNDLTVIDERHTLLAQLTGNIIDLEKLHTVVSSFELNEQVPDEIKSQYNVVRNMALYSYYCYSLAPEVQAKCFVLIEFGLRLREGSGRRLMLKNLLSLAIDKGWLCSRRFRYSPSFREEDDLSARLVKTIPPLRNRFAHGVHVVSPNCTSHLALCADILNQLFDG